MPARRPEASIAWSTSPAGPYTTVWTWSAGEASGQVLRWPEVDRSVDFNGATEVYVRYRVADLGMDCMRTSYHTVGKGASPVEITHEWAENGVPKRRTVVVPAHAEHFSYEIGTDPKASIQNVALIFRCL